jgi:NAD(P)-dependent dehydrogenase (short-subunit alcohol dehydrogenase family)
MNALVTGASRGVGFETCRALARSGVRKIIGVSRNKSGLEKLEGLIKDQSPQAEFIPVIMDLLDESSYASLEELIVSRMDGELNLLINNAGLLVNKPFQEIKMEDLHRVYGVNVFSVFKLTSMALHYIREGHVVNISSMGGVQGSVKFPGLSAYSSSKGALGILTECLAEEYKDSDVHFNCLAFGAVQTEMLEEAFPEYRAPISAEEMGAYVARFAIEEGRLFNGKIISVSSSTP